MKSFKIYKNINTPNYKTTNVQWKKSCIENKSLIH